MRLQEPVGSISTQLMKQAITKMKKAHARVAKAHAKARGSNVKVPRLGPAIPDVQRLARQAANRSLGIKRPGPISGVNLEQAARKAAGSSLRGWR